MIEYMRVNIHTQKCFFTLSICELTFPFHQNIDIPRNSFRAGALMQHNCFQRMCDGTTVTHHGYVWPTPILRLSQISLNLAYIFMADN